MIKISAHQETSNYQDLLKFLAIISMIIDHTGLYFFPEMSLLRSLGRFAMPIFCFFAGYNFNKKINFNLLALGFLLVTIETFLVFGHFTGANILIPIFIGQCYLLINQNFVNNFFSLYTQAILIVCLFPFTQDILCYGTLPISIMILGYIAKNLPANIKSSVLSIIFIALGHSYLVEYNFTLIDKIIAIFLAVFTYFALTYWNFKNKISYNISLVSRNSLMIYFLNLSSFGLIWRYCFISL